MRPGQPTALRPVAPQPVVSAVPLHTSQAPGAVQFAPGGAPGAPGVHAQPQMFQPRYPGAQPTANGAAPLQYKYDPLITVICSSVHMSWGATVNTCAVMAAFCVLQGGRRRFGEWEEAEEDLREGESAEGLEEGLEAGPGSACPGSQTLAKARAHKASEADTGILPKANGYGPRGTTRRAAVGNPRLRPHPAPSAPCSVPSAAAPANGCAKLKAMAKPKGSSKRLANKLAPKLPRKLAGDKPEEKMPPKEYLWRGQQVALRNAPPRRRSAHATSECCWQGIRTRQQHNLGALRLGTRFVDHCPGITWALPNVMVNWCGESRKACRPRPSRPRSGTRRWHAGGKLRKMQLLRKIQLLPMPATTSMVHMCTLRRQAA